MTRIAHTNGKLSYVAKRLRNQYGSPYGWECRRVGFDLTAEEAVEADLNAFSSLPEGGDDLYTQLWVCEEPLEDLAAARQYMSAPFGRHRRAQD